MGNPMLTVTGESRVDTIGGGKICDSNFGILNCLICIGLISIYMVHQNGRPEGIAPPVLPGSSGIAPSTIPGSIPFTDSDTPLIS